MTNTFNTPEFTQLFNSSATAVNDGAFCMLLDAGIDPGRAYDLTFATDPQFVLDPVS